MPLQRLRKELMIPNAARHAQPEITAAVNHARTDEMQKATSLPRPHGLDVQPPPMPPEKSGIEPRRHALRKYELTPLPAHFAFAFIYH